MKYKIFGPYEIPLRGGEFKTRIDKEDISEFWSSVDSGLDNACGIYIYSIKTKSNEKPWYVGKAQKQGFIKECFTHHKLVYYHEALAKSKGTPMIYFVARIRQKNSFSTPTSSKTGHRDIDFVEQMFIELAYNKNKGIRNKKNTKNAEKLVIEGIYNHKDRRRKSAKQLHDLLIGE